MAEILELAQLAEDDRVTEVYVGRRRIEAELHTQLPALRRRLVERTFEPAGGQGVDGVARQERRVG